MFRNRRGRRVDPVPFLVATAFAFLGTFSFLPGYCLTLGVPVGASVGLSAAVFAALTGASYHRMVWTARPDLRGEIPPERRLIRLFYIAVAVTAALAGLTLLLLSP